MAPAKKTRSSTKAAPKTIAEAEEAVAKIPPKSTLSKEASNPPKLFILPKDTTKAARIISLADPRTSSQCRYLCCPEKGFYEFKKIGYPKTTPRSTLYSPSTASDTTESSPNFSKGYVTKSADLFIATSIDPLLLLLPVLSPAPTKESSDIKQHFISFDDHLDNFIAQSPHIRSLVADYDSLKSLLESRLSVICDQVDAGDEKMYRISTKLLFDAIWKKAKAMVAAGLPASLEEKFVRKALEKPIASLKRGESSQLFLEEEDAIDSPMTSFDSVGSADTSSTDTSLTSTALTSVNGDDESSPIQSKEVKAAEVVIDAPEGIADKMRLRTALNFIFSSYIPPYIVMQLQEHMKSEAFTKSGALEGLDEYLENLTKLRQDAIAAREVGGFSRKRGFEDEMDAESRAEKKRKKEEEEKKAKAGISRGVRDLKKVNTTGMKKMSSFFKKI